MKNILLIALLVLMLFAVYLSTEEIQTDPFEKFREIMVGADQLYKQRGVLEKALLSFEKYKEALMEKPGAYEAMWKSAKAAFYLMEVIKNKKQKERIVKEAIQYAKQAIKIKPDGVEGHFWLGVNYTKYGEVKGILKALFLIRPTKREMRKVIQLNDTYEGGGAYVVMGRVYSQVPGILGGSDKKAREYYEKAREICPKNSLNLLFMAETYWDLDEERLAYKTLEELLMMEPDPQWVPETQKYKEEARKLLRKYKKK